MLNGKVAIVTGSERGIGAATARALAAHGANVVLNYFEDLTSAESVARECREHGRRTVVVFGDVSLYDSVQSIVREADRAFGRVDILVNNAGIFPRQNVSEIGEAEWDHVCDTNLKGSFLMSQAVVRSFVAKERKGVIVNVASSAVRGIPFGSHYCASKGGLVSLTRAMAVELGPHSIRVNAVAPGLIDTAQPRQGHSEGELEALACNLPLGRIGRPEEVAEVIVFLSSPSAEFITGQTIYVNGGGYMP